MIRVPFIKQQSTLNTFDPWGFPSTDSTKCVSKIFAGSRAGGNFRKLTVNLIKPLGLYYKNLFHLFNFTFLNVATGKI